MSGFADRFFWARHRANIGAPTIAQRTGCGQALVSNIEKGGAQSSKFNDKFAKLFGVDPNWLRTGEGKVPDGFDAAEAKRMREGGRGRSANVIHLGDYQAPRWAGAADDAPAAERADALQKRLFSDFQDYSALVGQERSLAFIEVLTRLTALVQPAAEKTERDDK